MAHRYSLLCGLLVASVAGAGEARFTDGPQELAGTRYYWLAEWKLLVTLPPDTRAGDKLEVLFGTKGEPRMNAVPEWFTVEPDRSRLYEVTDIDTRKTQKLSGAALREGLAIRLEPGKGLRLVVRPTREEKGGLP